MAPRIMRFIAPCALLVTPLAMGLSLAADPEPEALAKAFAEKWEHASVDELAQELNRLADTAIRRQQALQQRSTELDSAWLDPEVQSEQIETLRRRLRALEAELVATQQHLRSAVEELPHIRAQREALDRERQAIEALRAERQFVQRLLRSTLDANRAPPDGTDRDDGNPQP